MDTTAAAAQASVTVATVQHWCRYGAVEATKAAGRWIISATSLARRIALGAKKTKAPTIDRTREFLDQVTDQMYDLADRYSRTGLRQLAALVAARDTRHIALIDPAHVHLTDTQWARIQKNIRFQASCLDAER